MKSKYSIMVSFPEGFFAKRLTDPYWYFTSSRESHEIANMSYNVWKLAKDRDNQRALAAWRAGKGAVVSSPVGGKSGTNVPFNSLYNGTAESIKDAIGAHSGNWTLDDYQKVGTMVSDEVEKAVSDQDWQEAKNKIKWMAGAISQYIGSEKYKLALDADEYEAQRNVTINKTVKLVYDITGASAPDPTVSNNRMMKQRNILFYV